MLISLIYRPGLIGGGIWLILPSLTAFIYRMIPEPSIRQQLEERLHKIDTTYYNNLNDKESPISRQIIEQVARDAILKAEEYFKKGTTEDAMYGRMYRKIAKDLLEGLPLP
jgi:hypothetical protein